MNVFLIAALSVDGFIAVDDVQKATTWTTKADLRFFVQKTKEAGTVVMGRKTFDTIGKPLPDRRLIVLTSRPQELSAEGVEFTDEAPAALLARLEREGAPEVAIAGGASIYQQFMAADLVDELYISVMPKLFGTGIQLFNQLIDKDLQLLDVTTLDENTVLLHYAVAK